jgi:hypothetical protein
MELAERWHRTGVPFTREDDAAMYSMIQLASRMAQAGREVRVPADRDGGFRRRRGAGNAGVLDLTPAKTL